MAAVLVFRGAQGCLPQREAVAAKGVAKTARHSCAVLVGRAHAVMATLVARLH